MKTIKSYKVRLAGILILTLLRFAFSSSDALASPTPVSSEIYLYNFVTALIFSVVTWEMNRWVVIYFNRTYPYSRTGNKRFVKEIILVTLVNTGIYVTYILLMTLLDASSRPPFVFLLYGLLDRLIYGLLAAGFYEFLLFIHALRTATHEAEELKKINLAIQLESLKNQVKPHFLFNSLNTLTGLVETDTTKAVRFIAELSNVYRYLLQSSEKDLTSLSEELQFLRAYFFLLQTRFGSGIEMEIDLPAETGGWQLPPLTLQMLVENAVKHNRVSVKFPLKVTLRFEGPHWLIVSNNLQLKRNGTSTGMGLSNIAAKFRLLNQPEVQIVNSEDFFLIKVPLIKN